MKRIKGVLVLCLVCCCVANGRQQDYSGRLRALGYHRTEIMEIKASVARVVVRRGLPRPQGGMPESWKEEKFQKRNREPYNPLSIFKPFGRILKASSKLLFTVLKVAIPASVAVALAGGLWPLVQVAILQIRAATTKTVDRLSKPTIVMPPAREIPKIKATKLTPSYDNRQSLEPPPKQQRSPPEQPKEPPARRIREQPPQDLFILDGPDDASLRKR